MNKMIHLTISLWLTYLQILLFQISNHILELPLVGISKLISSFLPRVSAIPTPAVSVSLNPI